MYKATVNKKSFEIESSDDGMVINEKLIKSDIKQIQEGYFHLIHNQKSYTAEIVKTDFAMKSFQVKVNGKLLTVVLKDQFDLLLEKMGMNTSSTGKVNNIKAPMPGLIIEMKVSPGDIVKTGDSLLILEAMKMENIIKSTGEGVVKSVKVKKGESVEKNQVLIEF